MITPSTSVSLAHLDDLGKRYSKARAELSEEVADLQAEILKLQRARTAKIKRLAQLASTLGSDLRCFIEQHPNLFEKPRTFVVHGVTVGFKKGAGKIDWDDDDRVVAKIEKHFPDLVQQLLIVKKKPSVEGLETLATKDLEKLGCRVEGTGDKIVVRTSDSAIDKLVAKMVDEGETEVEA